MHSYPQITNGFNLYYLLTTICGSQISYNAFSDPKIILNFGEFSIKQDSHLEALFYDNRNALQMDGQVA